MTYRLGIIERQPLMVAGLEAFLGLTGRYEVAWHTGSLQDAARRAKSDPPDLMLIGEAFSAPAVAGKLRNILKQSLTRVVMWGPDLSERQRQECLRCGLHGVIDKTAGEDEMLSVVVFGSE